MTRDEFLAQNWPHALAVAQQTGIDPRIVMAQAGVESGWGSAAPNNNYFGMKDFSGGGASLPTTEVVDGKTVQVNQPFAQYESPAHSFAAYSNLMQSNPRYAKFTSAPGYGAQIAELGKSGYATAPNYASIIDKAAQDLTVPTGVQPSQLPVGNRFINGPGAGGQGVVAPTPASSDPRDQFTAPVAPADVLGTQADYMKGGLLAKQKSDAIASAAGMASKLGAGLLAGATTPAPHPVAPPQAHIPQPSQQGFPDFMQILAQQRLGRM